MKSKSTSNLILELLNNKNSPASNQEIYDWIRRNGNTSGKPSIRWALTGLNSSGKIKRLSRGVYASNEYLENIKKYNPTGLEADRKSPVEENDDAKPPVSEPEETLVRIPKQEIGANVTFVDNKITMATTSPERNNPNRQLLESLHAELLEKSKTAASLIKPTDNQYPRLGEEISKYLGSISMPLDEINYTSVFIRGGDLRGDFDSINSAIASDNFGEYPDLSAEKRSSIQKLLNVHQTFIGLSNEGSILLDAQARAKRSANEEREYRENLINFSAALKDDPDFIDEGLASLVEDLANSPLDNQNKFSKLELAGRYTRHIIILTGTVLTIGGSLGALATSVATLSPTLAAVGIVGTAAYKLTLEDAYKGSIAHKELTAVLTKQMDRLSDGDLKLIGKSVEFIKKFWGSIYPITEANGLDEWFDNLCNEHSAVFLKDEHVTALEKVDIFKFLSDVLDFHLNKERPGKEPAGITLAISCDPEIGKAHANSSYLHSVFEELITNSIEHNQKRPNISISAARKKEKIVISFQDSGVGISSETIKIITEQIRQKGFSSKSFESNSGLSKITTTLSAMNGELKYISSSHQGVHFEISLNSV